jgi:hypothetical protein
LLRVKMKPRRSTPSRDQGSQAHGGGSVGLHLCEVAIVDADDGGIGSERTSQLRLRMDLDHDLHRQSGRKGEQIAQRPILQDPHDQQHRIGPDRAGGHYLDGVDDEILAENRKVHRGAHGLQVIEAAPEELGLGEDRERRGAIGGVAARQPHRIVGRLQQTAGG